MKVVLVCSGNTCRSPMAEAVWRKMRPQDDCRSAGVAAFEGAPAAALAALVAESHGLDLRDHRSRRLTDDLVAWADVILTMTEDQRGAVTRRWPADAFRVVTLADVAAESGNVADPFGLDEAAYHKVFDQLERWIGRAASRLSFGAALGRVVSTAMTPGITVPIDALEEDLRQFGMRVNRSPSPLASVQTVTDGQAAWALLLGVTGVDVALTVFSVQGLTAAYAFGPNDVAEAFEAERPHVLCLSGARSTLDELRAMIAQYVSAAAFHQS